ncbi:hypothetical protein TNCV_2573161 [Trichonephila clavipes]|nr:hypothetical protein TNCV_2573161 [Trichonephila clavipes]
MPDGAIASSSEHPATETNVDRGMGSLTTRAYEQYGAEYGETVGSNPCNKERTHPILRIICLLFLLFDRQSWVAKL